MNVLVINCGSSSVKFKQYDVTADSGRMLANGAIEGIGSSRNHEQALASVMGQLPHHGAIQAVGHRVVHGGRHHSRPVVIDDAVLEQIRACAELAPLHNPVNLEGIRACRALLPGIPQVAVFDTAFHQTMDRAAYLYAIPYDYYERYHIRKYGFHGTSHQYVAEQTARFLNRPADRCKSVICHLGNGASITAVENMTVRDTSMGFSPLEGLVMGTRSGDIDAAVPVYLSRQLGIDAGEMETILNTRSGLLGLSGLSGDMSVLLAACENNDDRARRAVDVFVHRVIKYIGAYLALLNGANAIVFTAGIGERSALIRQRILSALSWMGVCIDHRKNSVQTDAARDISTPDSLIRALVIPTNEEWMIARQTVEALESS